MKALSFLILLFFALNIQAKNIFISTAGNDVNTGLSPATPWRTIAKLNASFNSINAGDSILFKRGDIFVGGIIMGKPGTSSLPIILGAYGLGIKPVISGFATLTNWTNSGNGIWKANNSAVSTELIVVTIDNNLARLGRYPNANAASGGWLYNEASNSSALTITDNELPSSPNWAGAEIAVRKQRWIIDRCKITAQNGGVLTYKNPTGTMGTPGAAKVGWGYFIQDDIRTLDQFGEWFLNKSNKDLSVFFGTANPASYTIKTATVDTLLNLGGGAGRSERSYITVENLLFEGANKVAVFGRFSTNITVQNCTIKNNYSGLDLQYVGNCKTNKDTIMNCINNGTVQTGSNLSNSTVTNNFIKNIGLFSGMGGSGDGQYAAVRQDGTYGNVSFNRIDSVGYIGVEYNGSGTKIYNNYISNFCLTKDDGGGIYSQGGIRSPVSEVYNNIVINGIGEPWGSSNHSLACEGIYTDDNSNGVFIHNNTVANIQHSGFFWNGTMNITMRNNTIYKASIALMATRSLSNQLLRQNIFSSNILYPTLSNIFYGNDRLLEPDAMSIQTDMRQIAKFDSNYYRNDISSQFDWAYHNHSVDYSGNFVDPPSVNFASWKTYINADAKSKVIGTTATRFEFNPTDVAKTISLDAKYLGVDSTVYNGTITLQPYTSAILLYSGAMVIAPPPPPVFTASAGKDTSVMLPATNTMLKGTANAAVSTYKWTKIAGPTQYSIANSNIANTGISNLTMGKYTFQLKVKNALGDSAIANINVTAIGTLPVTLLDFSAKNNQDKINLQWSVASEGDILQYAIERSTNGEIFENIGTIQSNNLADIQSNYNFPDKNPANGLNYYRLVLIEKSGKQSFSKTVSVTVTGKNNTAFTVNNVGINNTTIKIGLTSNAQQQIKVVAVDVSGRILYTELLQLQKGFNTFDKRLTAINTGIYYIKIFTNDLSVTKSVLATH